MFINFIQAKKCKTIHNHVPVRSIKRDLLCPPKFCTLRNLDRCFVHMNKTGTIFLAGLKSWDQNTVQNKSSIWEEETMARLQPDVVLRPCKS